MKSLAVVLSLILGLANSTNAASSPPAPTTILDVRTPEEFSENHIAGAINIDFRDSSFESKIKALSKEKTYALYCRSGNRSGQAERIMKSLGFKSVENLGSLQEASKKLKADCVIKPGC